MLSRYGEVVKLQLPAGPKEGRIFIGSQRLVHEVCDQERFEKIVTGGLEQARNVAGDGMSSRIP
jgi:cytochrome P450/NADPH-cytochrome P450 reductase